MVAEACDVIECFQAKLRLADSSQNWGKKKQDTFSKRLLAAKKSTLPMSGCQS